MNQVPWLVRRSWQGMIIFRIGFTAGSTLDWTKGLAKQFVQQYIRGALGIETIDKYISLRAQCFIFT